jgi:hypothetical protein
MKQFCLSIIVAIGFTIPALGQGADPFIGTWKLAAIVPSFSVSHQQFKFDRCAPPSRRRAIYPSPRGGSS